MEAERHARAFLSRLSKGLFAVAGVFLIIGLFLLPQTAEVFISLAIVIGILAVFPWLLTALLGIGTGRSQLRQSRERLRQAQREHEQAYQQDRLRKARRQAQEQALYERLRAQRLHDQANRRIQEIWQLRKRQEESRLNYIREHMAGMSNQEILELYAQMAAAGFNTTGFKHTHGNARPKAATKPVAACRVLKVAVTADEAEIKRAYRARCREYHPDLHPNDPVAEERFKEVQQAYQLLGH